MKTSEISSVDLNVTLRDLYKKWPEMKRFMHTLGCKSSDAEDIFQEALLIFTRKLKDSDFELTVEPYFYVKNTCKFLWYNQARKEGKNPTVEITENVPDFEDDWFQKELKLMSIEKAIRSIGKKCQDLIRMFYGEHLNMTEIAKRLDFRNEHVAKAQKYRCINKVKEEIHSNSPEIL